MAHAGILETSLDASYDREEVTKLELDRAGILDIGVDYRKVPRAKKTKETE